MDEEIKAKAEKRAEKLKKKQLSKEEKEEKRKINRESREKKKKLKDVLKKRKRGEEIDEEEEQIIEENTNEDGRVITTTTAEKAPKKSKKEKQEEEHGVWVGNLAFSTTSDGIRKFFEECGEIQRIKCPKGEGRQKQNKGFAYVIFAEKEAIEKAVGKSEQKLDGRSLLIKDAKDYNRKDGIQPPTKESKKQKNPPCPTLFVGNLDFNTTREMLQEVFAWAGEIRSVRLGTFEDSGKCKGFGYIDYETVDSATKAIRAPDKHKIGDRKIRVEFASEEAHKRSKPWLLRREKTNQKGGSSQHNNNYNKDAVSNNSSNDHQHHHHKNNNHSFEDSSDQQQQQQYRRPRKEYTPREKKPEHQGRVKPGAALSQAHRQKPTVQEFKGTKIVFD
ncbi:unnamed protein product [Cunninghamella echinulata]